MAAATILTSSPPLQSPPPVASKPNFEPSRLQVLKDAVRIITPPNLSQPRQTLAPAVRLQDLLAGRGVVHEEERVQQAPGPGLAFDGRQHRRRELRHVGVVGRVRPLQEEVEGCSRGAFGSG